MNRFLRPIVATLALGAAIPLTAGSASAQRINCANEFRSGKLYFSQQIYDKAVARFQTAVEVCPEKAEYRARYAIALAQYADVRLDDILTMPEGDARQAGLDSVITMYTTAGGEFDSSLAYDSGKKNQKFVRENREHYWVGRYNEGIKRLNDQKYKRAALQFKLARLVNPDDVKAYSQGALALINLDEKSEAASLVKAGLEKDPKDQSLNKLLESIYLDAAKSLTQDAEKLATKPDQAAQGEAKAKEALDYLNQVLDRRGGKDPDVLFDRGTAYLALGRAIDEADTAQGVPAGAVDACMKAATDFSSAAELVPVDDPDNRDFHLAARFNEIQAYLNAEKYDETLEKIKAYAAIDPMDPAIWQMWAICLNQKGDSNGAVAALMTYKSLKGTKVTVDDAIKTAQKDSKAALDTMGKPDAVYSYQDTGSGEVIETWIWSAKHKAVNYVLGVKNGELSW